MAKTKQQSLSGADEVTAMVRGIAAAIQREFPPARLAETAFLGIQVNGVPLARRLAAAIGRKHGITPPVGTIDITMYRDDVGRRQQLHRLNPTEIPFDLEDRIIILVDEVLHTGRTIRAALDAVTYFGRPRMIRLAVLVDRAGREFPIRADYAGRTIDLPDTARVRVQWRETHGRDAVDIVPAPKPTRSRP